MLPRRSLPQAQAPLKRRILMGGPQQRYFIDASAARAVEQLGKLTWLPTSAAKCAGVTCFDGEIYTVLKLWEPSNPGLPARFGLRLRDQPYIVGAGSPERFQIVDGDQAVLGARDLIEQLAEWTQTG